MELITRDELKAKLDRGDDFHLIMVLGEPAYRAMHIPGSEHFPNPMEVVEKVDPEEEVVVYCSGESCMASATAYWFLESKGYKNLRRYAGGLEDWHAAGYPMEGEQA